MPTLQKEKATERLSALDPLTLLEATMPIEEPQIETPKSRVSTFGLRGGFMGSENGLPITPRTSPLPPCPNSPTTPSTILSVQTQDSYAQLLPRLPEPSVLANMNSSMARTLQSQSSLSLPTPLSTPGYQDRSGSHGIGIYQPCSMRRCGSHLASLALHPAVQGHAGVDSQREGSLNASPSLPFSVRDPQSLPSIRQGPPLSSPWRGSFQELPPNHLVPQSPIPGQSFGRAYTTGHHCIPRSIGKIHRRECFLATRHGYDGVSYRVSWQPSVVPESTYRLQSALIKLHSTYIVPLQSLRGMKLKIYWKDDWVSFSGTKKVQVEGLLGTATENNRDIFTIIYQNSSARIQEWLSSLFSRASDLGRSVIANSVLRTPSPPSPVVRSLPIGGHAKVQDWLNTLFNEFSHMEEGETANLPSPRQSSPSKSILYPPTHISLPAQIFALPLRLRGGNLRDGEFLIDKSNVTPSLSEHSDDSQVREDGIQSLHDFSNTFRRFRLSRSISPCHYHRNDPNTPSTQQPGTQSAPVYPASTWKYPAESNVKIRHRRPQRSFSTDLEVCTAAIYPGSVWQLVDPKTQSLARDSERSSSTDLDVQTRSVFDNSSPDTPPIVHLASASTTAGVTLTSRAKSPVLGCGSFRIYEPTVSISGSDSEVINDVLMSSEIYKSNPTRQKRKFESKLLENPPDGGLEKRLKVFQTEAVLHVTPKRKFERPSSGKKRARVIVSPSADSYEGLKEHAMRDFPGTNNESDRRHDVAKWVHGIQQHLPDPAPVQDMPWRPSRDFNSKFDFDSRPLQDAEVSLASCNTESWYQETILGMLTNRPGRVC